MKVNEKALDIDLLCQDSLDMLTSGVQSYFQKYFPEEGVWFCDNSSLWINQEKTKPIKHIVLFGNYLRSLSEMALWPGQEVRIWVLSTSIQKIVCEFTKLQKDQVGVISRNEILNAQNFKKDLSKNFFYSGRISRQKNISELILISYFLQTHYDANYQLELVGEFDQLNQDDLGRFDYKFAYQENINQLIANLVFKTPPIFHGKFSKSDWLKVVQGEKSFINVSTFFMEDYGMSVQQALAYEHSGLLSHWGGHRDINNESVNFINPNYIPNQSMPKIVKFYLCETIAQMIHERKFIDKNELSFKDTFFQPASINIPQRLEALKVLKESFGPEIALIARDHIAYFADFPSGKKMFDKIHEHMGLSTSGKIIVYATPADHMDLIEQEEIYSCLKNGSNFDYRYEFMNLSHLSKNKLFSCNEVILTSKAQVLLGKNVKFFESFSQKLSILSRRENIPESFKKLPDEF